MGQESLDPFAWSLDAAIASVGVGVSLIGALATVLVAVMALKATNRANRAEAASRERAERAGLVPAVATYLATWEADDVRDTTAKGLDADIALDSAAAGVSDDARRVVRWLIGALEALVTETFADHRGWDADVGERMLNLAVWGGRIEARRRVDDWVATGVLDDSALVKRAIGPPDIEGRYPRPRDV